jgi:hypothetical protein
VFFRAKINTKSIQLISILAAWQTPVDVPISAHFMQVRASSKAKRTTKLEFQVPTLSATYYGDYPLLDSLDLRSKRLSIPPYLMPVIYPWGFNIVSFTNPLPSITYTNTKSKTWDREIREERGTHGAIEKLT